MDTTQFGYDGDGNENGSAKRLWQWNNSWAQAFRVSTGTEWTWSLYGADNKLRVSQRSWNDVTGRRHTFVEHRYDALGRRVLTRTQSDSSCTGQTPPACLSPMERFVWDGDQLLLEMRAALPYTAHGEVLESETSGSSDFHGWVRYVQGPEMDRPVWFVTDGEGAVVPHWGFRGMAVAGSSAQTGQPLTTVVWPGRDAGAYFGPDTRVSPAVPNRWLGSLLVGQADATGLMYRRNRYFNPAAAQFTQEDPIGLAGGLNLYGFANGDPVNFSDPFGLFVCPPNCPDFTEADSRAVFARLAAMAPAINRGLSTAGAISFAPAIAMAAPAAGLTTLGLTAQSAALGAGLGIVPSAIEKVNAVASRMGVSGGSLLRNVLSRGKEFIDTRNSGNINVLLERPDGAAGFVRATLDPTSSRVISAGMMRADQVRRLVENGTFVPR